MRKKLFIIGLILFIGMSAYLAQEVSAYDAGAYGAVGDYVQDIPTDVTISSDLTLSGSTSNLYIDGAVMTDLTISGTTLSLWLPDIKSGSDQAGAGAIAGEVWADSDIEHTLKLGQ